MAELKANDRLTQIGRRSLGQQIEPAKAQKAISFQLVEPMSPPKGFQLQPMTLRKFRSDVVHLLYTDGLIAFSLFESKGKPPGGPGGSVARGSQEVLTEYIDQTPVQVMTNIERGCWVDVATLTPRLHPPPVSL